MAVPQTVNLTPLHIRILSNLGTVEILRAATLCEWAQGDMWVRFGEEVTAQDVRTACLELEHLGFVTVDAATADWSLTDAGRKMYAMAKAKARKPDFVDKTKH